MAKDLEVGYSDTGYIPETGDNLGKLGEMEKKEKKEERKEYMMYENLGWKTEEDVGGFLERRNTCDRM